MTGHLQDLHLPRANDVGSFWGSEVGWTPAHSEAALLLGECVAVGAVLGAVTELTRLVWERRTG